MRTGFGVRSLDFHLQHLKFVVQKADGNISGLHAVAEIFKQSKTLTAV